jgi:hypothetical protein
MAFLDLSKQSVSQSMERGSVLPILEKWRLLKELYSTVSNKVVLGTLESEWLNQDNGVNQGCIWSPSLFSVMMKNLTDINIFSYYQYF